MGFHRGAEPTSRRRGIAAWPVVVLGLAGLLLVGWFGWSYLGGVLDRRAAAELDGCVAGPTTIRVAAAPSVVGTVEQAADAWASTHPVVQDHCVQVEVHALPSKAVLDGLVNGWDVGKLGPPPTAWLPESTLWANRLAAQNNGLITAQSGSVGTSPVLLAMPDPAATALQSGNGFRWSSLPDLMSSADAWSGYGKPEWGNLRVALPDLTTNPATAMAVQSALAGAGSTGAGPVTARMLADQKVQDVTTRLATNRITGVPGTTADALTKLADTTDPAAATFQAVPVFEVDLYRRNLGMDGAVPPNRALVGVAAGGPNPVADFPFVTLNADRSDPGLAGTLNRAGQLFGDFLRSPAERRVFALSGLREPGINQHPNPSPGVRWGATTENLVPADANTTQQISAAWSDAATGGEAVTMLLDGSQSMSADGGDGRSRLDWLKAALDGQTDRALAGSLGLWEFSRRDDGLSYRQLVATGPVRGQRAELHRAVANLKPAGGSQLSGSVLAAYRYAAAHYQDGRPNQLVVVTASPIDADSNLDQLKSALKSVSSTLRPLPIDIVAVGPDPDVAALTDLAKSTGGRITVAQDGKSIEPALGQILSSAG